MKKVYANMFFTYFPNLTLHVPKDDMFRPKYVIHLLPGQERNWGPVVLCDSQ